MVSPGTGGVDEPLMGTGRIADLYPARSKTDAHIITALRDTR
ncbi:hypothetical protein ACTD5D_17365 [Nocardia takedensis]|nr:hypothetical protein [Nocardia takedensis]